MIAHLISPHVKDLGGFTVKRVLPTRQKKMVGPFVFFDEMGPAEFMRGQGVDVRPHPHIGISTLTYMLDGELVHRDSLGFEQEITPGAVNWMTAGSGVAHSERSPRSAREVNQKRLHGIQTWIALPKKDEEVSAEFFHHPQHNIPEVSDRGVRVRVVAGHCAGVPSPVKVYSPITYLDVTMEQGMRWTLERPDEELSLYLIEGSVKVKDAPIPTSELAVWQIGSPVEVIATAQSRFLVIGGQPLTEPRYVWWNFVSSSADRIEQAKQDWVTGNFKSVPGESEFIPLPEG